MPLDVYHHYYANIIGHEKCYALLSEEDAPDTAIVFVHGFAGSPIKTWLNFQGMVDGSPVRPELWRHSDLYFYRYSSVLQHIYQNGERLVRFINKIFPAPVDGLLSATRDVVKDKIYIGRERTNIVARKGYQELVLVGHSEGGLLIRQSLLLEAKRVKDVDVAKIRTDRSPSIFYARLRLFAPALLGARPSGWIGVLHQTIAYGNLKRLMVGSRAYADMTSIPKLAEIKEGTDHFAEKWPEFRGFRALNLWGESDSIVTPGDYKYDVPDMEDGKEHTSVCKPTHKYLKPLEFVSGI